MMDLIASLATASQAIGIVKELRAIEKNVDTAEHRAKLAEVLGLLADNKIALADAQEALSAKDAEIARLKAAFAEQKELAVGEGDYLYKVDENGRKIGYPICPRCREVENRIVQLKQDGGISEAKCPVCLKRHTPVTCYLPHEEGSPATAQEAAAIKARERRARDNATIGHRQGRGSWMGR